MARYTPKCLQRDVDTINGWFAEERSRRRLLCGGRNGYQAVDAYSVDADGRQIGSGVGRNIECGTSHECFQAAFAYYGEHRRAPSAS